MDDGNEAVLQKLAPSIVEIISNEEKEEDSTTLGTGFVVTDDGLVVTCRHVVTESEDKLRNTVKARFYSDFIKANSDNTGINIDTISKYTMTLAEDYTYESPVDLAFFKLDLTSFSEKNIKLIPIELDDKVVSLNKFVTMGFRKAHQFSGLMAEGSVGIPTNIRAEEGTLSPQLVQLYHKKQIEPGMSGAPVFDIKRNRVVGIITERYKPIDHLDEDTLAFALPVKSMIELYPNLRQKNRGLTVLSKFLRAIGEEGSSIYKWIDEVYVHPVEYDEIKESLKSKRIVFITGTKEFGKTFTAVRLMYEFFKEEGYQPKWVKERKEQGRPEGSDPQELARIRLEEDYIKPHQIVYFEDPFGKTKYESYGDLENYIGSIINTIKRVQDAYIIITSREEVFKEFERKKIRSVELANFEKKMNLKRASYDTEKRKEMLLRWAKVNNCKWLLDSALRELVVKAIENQELLPTPLNIKDFILASHDILDSKQLEESMKRISKETTERFADEIMMMEEDEKVIFLAFPYVSTLAVDFIKKMYESIITARTDSDQKYYMDFDRVKKWFEGDKITISEYKIAFSHPSYREAFQYAIGSEKRDSARIRAIFIDVLLKLADNDRATEGVADAILSNFNNLPPNVQQLLFKLADNDEAVWGIAMGIAENFNNLPPNVQQLLFKLPHSDKAAWDVASAIEESFDKLPSNVREQLLMKLADNNKASERVAFAILDGFDLLRSNIQEQLLLKLAHNDKAASAVASLITKNFNNLPPNVQQLLFKLADNDEAALAIARRIVSNFNNLPPNVQQLLFKLADNDAAVWGIAQAITENFNNLPSNVREQLLMKLADNHKAAGDVAIGIVSNFNNLPPNVQQLLFKLADNDAAVSGIAMGIAENFNNLPPNVQQLLFKLADNDAAVWGIASAIEQSFNNLPSNVREQLLMKLADNDKAASSVVSAIAKNFNNLPSNVREQLLMKLADNDKAAFYVATVIASNFDKLPSNVQQLLFKLADNDEAVWHLGIAIVWNFNNLPPNVQQLLFKLADNDAAVWGIASAIEQSFNNLPSNVREQLLMKLADNDKAASSVVSAIAKNFNKLPPHVQQLLIKLADKDSTTGIVSSVIKEYSDNIPDDMKKEILAKLQEKGVTP